MVKKIWHNHEFKTSPLLVTYANDHDIDLADAKVIQDTLGSWHLIYATEE